MNGQISQLMSSLLGTPISVGQLQFSLGYAAVVVLAWFHGRRSKK